MSARTGGLCGSAAYLLWLLSALACLDGAFSQSVIITADPALPASLANPLTLTCTVTLNGLTEISWTDSRVTNTSNELSTDLSTGVSTLTIPDVVSADLGEYVCTATDGTASINYVITVTAIFDVGSVTLLPLIIAPPFYTGTELMIHCDVFLPTSVHFDTNLNLMTEVSLEKDGVNVPNGGRFTIGELEFFTPFVGMQLYRSIITISPLVWTTDIGQWVCIVNFTSSDTFVIPSSYMSEVYSLNEVEVPALEFSIPTALVEPSLVRVPDVYQQDIAFTCTGTVPKMMVVDMEIVWSVDGVDTTAGVGPISNAMGPTSTSELQMMAPGVSGTYNYTCRVIVAVEGDPEQQDSASALLNVTSPAIPNPPVSLATLHVSDNAATIVWVVTEVAYTNESYIVQYGTDANDLTNSSPLVDGGINFSAVDEEFQTIIEGLKTDTQYYFTVLAINSEGNVSSVQGTFTTLELPPSAPPSNFSMIALGHTYVQLFWDPPPSEFQNGAITSYTLNCQSSIPVPAPTFNDTYQNESFTARGGVMTNITVLFPGITYICSVLATNGAGDSPPAMINVTTIEQLPIGEPLNFIVMANGSREIVFSWEPPAFEEQRGIITSYQLSCTSVRDGNIVIDMSYPTARSNVALDGFSPDTTYACSVNAINSVGPGPAAFGNATTNPAAPNGTPTEFTVSSVEDDPELLMLTWGPVPEGNQNGMITEYIYRCGSFPNASVLADPNLETNGYSEQVGGLQSNTPYTCYVRARNVVGVGPEAQGTAMTAMGPTESPEQEDSSAVAVISASVVVVIVLIVVISISIILAAVFYLRYTQRKAHLTSNGSMAEEMVTLPEEKFNSLKDDEYKEAPQYDEIQTPSLVVERRKLIPKSLFSQHVKEMHEKRERGFEEEYTMLPTDTPQGACEIAKKSVNRPKNKFANICPFDSSRVTLQLIEGQEGSDYINASYIDGYERENAYIAAQGPMQNTVTDFWRMIVEHKLTTIVMLTKCIEAGKRKCEQYCPDVPKECKDYGHGIRVELISITPYADFEMRKMKVTQADSASEPLEVTHWEFLGWPDHGVPKFATSLISFIRHVRHEYKKNQTTSPMLVHCSAGVGRTGTFIVLDYMLERLVHEDTINIHDFLINMRSRRVLMVQTLAQYVFIHDALDELITCGETDISIHKFKNTITHLHKEIPGRGISGFESQFKLLDAVSRRPLPSESSDARQTYNDHKNRYPDRLPYDASRARLRPTGMQGGDYINASFVDGYKTRNSYIATQGPLLSTITDFWRMVWEFKSKCIIMLCNLEENSLESSASYWPEKVGEPQKQGNRLVVTLLEEIPKKDYVVRKLELKETTAQGVTFVVTHLHFTEWPENALPASCDGLLSMLDEVNKIQRTTGNKPITVMCNDGMGRTGTLICLHAQQERVKTEGVLDIFHFIKSCRIQRPKLVATLEQYIFCHEAMDKFLEMFDVYCNFK